MLVTIIRSVEYLARQGLALRGHSSDEGNFIQLLKFLGESDPAVNAWLARDREKYISGEIQNEILWIMAHSIICKLFHFVHDNTYFALMVTDLSNCEQFVVCLCWIDNFTFTVNEDLVGLY